MPVTRTTEFHHVWRGVLRKLHSDANNMTPDRNAMRNTQHTCHTILSSHKDVTNLSQSGVNFRHTAQCVIFSRAALGGKTCCFGLPGLASVRSRGSTPLLRPPRPRPSPRPETEGVKIAGEFAGVILPAMAGVEAVRRLLNGSSSIYELQLSQVRFQSQPMTVLYSVSGCVQSIHTQEH